MALNMFIKIDSIKGESQDDKHKDEIDVLSWSWGLEQSAAIPPGGGGGAGKVSVHDLAMTKRTDIATPQLMLACANGKHIKEALLTVQKPDRNQFEFVRIKMNDVIVRAVSTADSTDDSITENVALNFTKVQVDYVQQKADGTAGRTCQFKWDFRANKPF
jgi:type VI secretion system secreted protein Hcp